MRQPLRVLSVVVVIVIAAASVADAGWVLPGEGGETLISKGRMKSSWDNGAMIFIASDDAIHIIDDGRKVIASGTVEEFCTEMKQGIEKMMEQIPEEQREMMKEMMGGGEPPKVEIVKKGKGEEIAGFGTVRYEVMADGELYEELWLANNKELDKDCKAVMKMMGRFITCMDDISSIGGTPSPEASPEYAKLFGMGVLVKSVRHGEEGEPEMSEIAKRDVSDKTFALPDGYKTVAFASIWQMGE